MAWRHPIQNSSFSSFSSEPFHQPSTEEDKFSAFEEQLQESPSFGLQYTIHELQEKITKLSQTNNILMKQNQLLKQENSLCKETINKIKEQNSQSQLQSKQHKYQELVSEVNRLRKSLNEMRTIADTKDTANQKLKHEVHELRSIMKEQSWKDEFVRLFSDMVCKISHQIQPEWSHKKQVQIGWKMAKNIIKKAMHQGISIPKVIKNTDLSQYQPYQ